MTKNFLVKLLVFNFLVNFCQSLCITSGYDRHRHGYVDGRHTWLFLLHEPSLISATPSSRRSAGPGRCVCRGYIRCGVSVVALQDRPCETQIIGELTGRPANIHRVQDVWPPHVRRSNDLS